MAASGDARSARRLAAVAQFALTLGPPVTTDGGCERDPHYFRVILPPRYCTEHDRGILFPRGHLLPVWPWGFDSRYWRAWQRKCVGRNFVAGHASRACRVKPLVLTTESILDASRFRPPRGGRPWSEGDSVRFTVLATRSGAFLVENMHFVVGALPIIDQHAVVDSLKPKSPDRARSTLAASPAAVIRIEALRPKTRLGTFDMMRILLTHGPPDVDVYVTYGGTRSPSSGFTPRNSKYPPAKPGALGVGPLKAAGMGRMRVPEACEPLEAAERGR